MTSAQAQAAITAIQLTDAERDAMRAAEWASLHPDTMVLVMRLSAVGHMPPFIPAVLPSWSDLDEHEKEEIIRTALLLRSHAEFLRDLH